MKQTILQEIVLSGRLTQVQIAEKMNVSPQLFNWMIKNPKQLRPEQIKAFAEAVGRSPRNIFSLIINN